MMAPRETMQAPVTIEMMSQAAPLWRCLHGGPLSSDSLERWEPSPTMAWAELRARNLPLLRNLTTSYGACAVVARLGASFVGHLRFYPRAVCDLAESGPAMCLQQRLPSGPAMDFGLRRFPPPEEIEDKTLVVHCMMVSSRDQGGEALLRRGIATLMARELIDWARARRWGAIEATAPEDLPIVWAITGQAGKSFWEKLGFRLDRTEREPALEQESDFARRMRDEARAKGLDPDAIARRHVMRLLLR